MRKLILLTCVFVISFQLVNAQDIFKEHGFDKEPLTLSKGHYNEFFTNDEVVQIGTVLLNTRTNKIVALVDEETSETPYMAELSSRWSSPDPLAAKYPEVSPYVYALNNPIKFIDPDGMRVDEWELTLKPDGIKDLKWLNDKGGDKTQYVNVKWDTGDGETWDLGTEAWNNWPNSEPAMLDIMSHGEAALGSWNPGWWDNSSGQIDYSPIDPVDIMTGAMAAKWAMSGAKIAAKESTGALDGSFSVFNWKGYPSGGIKPTGPFRLLEGAEYTSARNLANSTNLALRRANPEMFKGLQIHEIHPVKFGGSPTSLSNKIFLTPAQHAEYTNFWNSLLRSTN